MGEQTSSNWYALNFLVLIIEPFVLVCYAEISCVMIYYYRPYAAFMIGPRAAWWVYSGLPIYRVSVENSLDLLGREK